MSEQNRRFGVIWKFAKEKSIVINNGMKESS
jgi:hypothetical protein